jgi:hypothetical protein
MRESRLIYFLAPLKWLLALTLFGLAAWALLAYASPVVPSLSFEGLAIKGIPATLIFSAAGVAVVEFWRITPSVRCLRWSHRSVATLRDLVEILALVAAGAWAVFIWVVPEIKARSQPPSLSLVGSLRDFGIRDNLILVGFKSDIRNTGRTDATIVAFSVTAVGHYCDKSVRPQPNIYHRYDGQENEEIVYRKIILTKVAYARSKQSLILPAGENYPLSDYFFVHRKKYDVVSLYVVAAYVRQGQQGSKPTTWHKGDIYPNFYNKQNQDDPGYYYAHTLVDQIPIPNYQPQRCNHSPHA